MKDIYISHPITADTDEQTDANIEKARQIAYTIWKLGYGCFVPGMNDKGAHRYGISYDELIQFDLRMINNLDGVFMVDGWQDSKGCRIERGYARQMGIPVFYSIDELKKFKNGKMGFKQKRETKFIQGAAEHHDQDFSSLNHLEEVEEELFDISNYIIGWMKGGRTPYILRLLWGWKARIIIRMTYWGVVLLRKLWER